MNCYRSYSPAVSEDKQQAKEQKQLQPFNASWNQFPLTDPLKMCWQWVALPPTVVELHVSWESQVGKKTQPWLPTTPILLCNNTVGFFHPLQQNILRWLCTSIDGQTHLAAPSIWHQHQPYKSEYPWLLM